MKKKASTLRKIQNYYLKNHVSTLPDVVTVLNLGALPNDKDKQGSYYKDYFKGKVYWTLDKNRESSSFHHIKLDLHEIDKYNYKFDLIIAMSLLEHVENPFIVCDNIKKLVNPKGYVYISVPFFYPLHKDPHGRFTDYWRFTDDTLKMLFGDLKLIWIKSVPSVIKSATERYWNDKNRTVSGYCALFRK